MFGGVRAAVYALLLALPVAVSGQKSIGSYDFIVVGSGPGGATTAQYLTKDTKYKVLLLEAGADLDKVPAIKRAQYAPSLEDMEALAKYYYSVPNLPNIRSNGNDMYIAGRLMGGSSSVNGNQWVRPSDAYLKKLYDAANATNEGVADPDWEVDKLRNILIEIEKFTGSGVRANVHGTSGRVPVRMSPDNETASGAARKFINALSSVTGLGEIKDYNDPATPTGVFTQWQLSQTNDGDRASSSNSMLGDARSRTNLVLRTRATVLFVDIDKKNVAKGVTFLQDGMLYKAMARREIILSGGIRTSLILENSGIGSAAKIQQHVDGAGRKMKVDLPGVGENLQNEGYLTMTFKRNKKDSVSPVLYDLYAGGAFINYPYEGIATLAANNATECKDRRRLMDRTRALHGSMDDGHSDGNDDPLCIGASGKGDRLLEEALSPAEEHTQHRELHVSKSNLTRFSQWIGVETGSTLSVLATFLAAGSKGSVHIQSPDPTTWPLADPNIFAGSHDIEYTCGMVQYQMLPFAKKLVADNPEMELISPTLKELGDLEQGTSCSETMRWVYNKYVHTHHWFGTTKMATRLKGGVVDNHGQVYGVTRLRVADNSVLPAKPDGSTQVPAYLVGAVIAKKILATSAKK